MIIGFFNVKKVVLKMSNLKYYTRYICSIGILFFSVIGTSTGAEYWVTKLGSDANGCTNSTTDSCLSIQKGISIARLPGDTLNIGAGTYVEDSVTSPFTTKAEWLDGDYASLGLDYSGTLGNPITIQAAPGDEGKVILDSQMSRVGIQTMFSDYVHIRGLTLINNYLIGIASWGQQSNVIADEEMLSIGVVIENCYIYNTGGPYGKNMSAIGMWGSKNWIVRNNKLEKVYTQNSTRGGQGIQAYGVINALIENNDIKDVTHGIFWKDHFVKDLARTPVFESEIRFNKIQATTTGVYVGTRGTGTVEAGENYVHHNIIYGYGDSGYAVRVNASNAFAISALVRIENNLFDAEGSKSFHISIDGSEKAYIKGNIFTRSTGTDIALIKYSKPGELLESDYNVYDMDSLFTVDKYSETSKNYTSLSAWQVAKRADSTTLGIDNPDANSINRPYSALFIEPNVNRDYKYLIDSSAIGLMPDSSNAGPYQYGSEIIGSSILLNTRPRAPDWVD